MEAASKSASAPPATTEIALPHEVDLKVAEEFVRIGYRLDEQQRFQSTEFLTPRLRTSQAAHLIRLVKRYNDFEGENVASAVAALKGRVSSVAFGREGSPVLYIELPHWTHKREEAIGTGVRIDAGENEKFVVELRALFLENLQADEFSVRNRRIRIWWD